MRINYNLFLAGLFLFVYSLNGQIQSDYRKSEITGCYTNYFPVRPTQKSNSAFAPGVQFTWTSFKTDSLGKQFSGWHFIAIGGVNFYEYNYVTIDSVIVHPLSKRFYTGFGLSFNKAISKKIRVTFELCPVLQSIFDKSRERIPYSYKTINPSGDTIMKQTFYYFRDNGLTLQLHSQLKLERVINKEWNFCILAAYSPTITDFFSKEPYPYNNPFKGQLYFGIGLNWKNFYKLVNETEIK